MNAVVFCAVHQLCISAIPVHTGMDKFLAEIEQADQLPPSGLAAERDHPAVAAVLHPHIRVSVEARLPGPDGLHPPQATEELTLEGLRVVPPLRHIPPELSPVEIPAVLPLLRVIVIGIVVALADLIPAVDHRNAALRQHPRVQGQVAGDRPLHSERIPLRRFQTAQRSGGAAEPGVPQPGIVVV